MSTVFMAIKMPTRIYIVPPMCLCALDCVILLPILMHLGIPQGTAVHENTKEALRIWRLQATIVTTKRQTHFRKILKSMRPCLFYAGLDDTILFFSMRMSGITCFYYTMIHYVASFLISNPPGPALPNFEYG